MARAMTGTTDRVIALLRCVAEASGGMTQMELARALDLAPSTVHRMLDRLGALGIVQTNDDRRRYVAGLEFYRMSALVVGRTDFVQIARRGLADLADETGETCFLSLYMPHERQMIYDARVAGPGAIQVTTDLHAPHGLASGAAGLAMLSALPPLEVDGIFSREEVMSRASLFDSLAGIRRLGYGLCHDEYIREAVEIAAPLSDVSGRMVGALSIAIPSANFDPGAEAFLCRVVMEHTDRLSKFLGDTNDRRERRGLKDWTMGD